MHDQSKRLRQEFGSSAAEVQEAHHAIMRAYSRMAVGRGSGPTLAELDRMSAAVQTSQTAGRQYSDYLNSSVRRLFAL